MTDERKYASIVKRGLALKKRRLLAITYKMAEQTVTLANVKEAADTIRPFIHRTPVFTSQYFDDLTARKLHFKCEIFQKTGAFKIRGATNAIHKILAKSNGRSPVIVTHSSGNNAQAVALASKIKNIRAVVVMPENAPQTKKDAVKGYGAEIVESDPTHEGRELTTKKVMEKIGEDAVFLSSSNHVDVIAGQGTMALELLEDVPDLEAVIVPVSGGGMLSGFCVACKGINPAIKVFAAEPKNADDCARSFAAKRRIPNESHPKTIADGLMMNLGDITWPIIRDNITDVLTVSEDEIRSAMRKVYGRMKLVIEPSAAVGVAAVLSETFKTKYPDLKKVGVVLCGGNVDLDNLPWYQR